MLPPFLRAADDAPNVSQLFSTTLFTGAGGTQSVATGIDLTGGGLYWSKCRSATDSNQLVRVSGSSGGARLISDGTNAEASYNGSEFAAASNGNVSVANGNLNASTFTYAAWAFKEAARFFDVVTWTGNGTAGRQISHNLGVAPGIIIVKSRSDAEVWRVYHRSLGNANTLQLQDTAAADTLNPSFNSTDPTASVFTLGAGNQVNGTGKTYVAYLFAHDTASDGIVQCGSYTGNGSATGPTVTLGWNPQWVMIKRTTGAADWVIFDTARGIVSGNDPTLCPSNSAAEDGTFSAADYIDLTGSGFQIANSATFVNANTETYAFVAIRSA